MNQPLVSVVMLSWNRRDDLRISLGHVFETDYPTIEVIVVDNHSTDGTLEMLGEEYPAVTVISLAENIGIAGWNKGFEIAKGEYILVLDDDSYPVRSALSTGMARIVQAPECGVLAMQVFNMHRQSVQTSSLVPGNNTTFVGCGAILRADMLKTVGMFEPLLFLYMHETEFTMRVIDKGFTVMYEPAAVVYHISSPSHRRIGGDSGIDSRRQYFLARNLCIALVLHFSVTRLIFRLPRIAAGRIIFGLKYRCSASITRGIGSFFRNVPIIIQKRLVVSERTQRMYNYGSFAGGFFFSDGANNISRPEWLKSRRFRKTKRAQ